MLRTIGFVAVVAIEFAAVRALGAVDSVPTKPMGGHMEVTLRTAAAPGDAQRANAIVDAARHVIAEYPTTADAERAGFTKFLPRARLPIEHFTSHAYALEAWRGHFDPMHPTSLIFERNGDALHIVGVMYTAPNRATQEQLNADVPTSIATWHRHVNFCVPPAGTPRSESTGPNARFLFGSIVSADECAAAHGWFASRVLGWMIHVWPNETDPAKVWAVDRGDGMSDHDMMMGDGAPRHFDGLPIALNRLPQQPVAAGDPNAGARVFALHCEECHGAGGRNGPDAPALAGTHLAAGQVAYMVRHPKGIDPHSAMPELPLTDGELADVSAYVASLSTTEKSGP
jgi:mono/diheme cytochrome c family protein